MDSPSSVTQVPIDVLNLIEARVANERKSPFVAYGLWFFLGVVGAHWIYMGRWGSVFIYWILWLIGFLTTILWWTPIVSILVGIVWVVDFFRLICATEKRTKALREEMIARYLQTGHL